MDTGALEKLIAGGRDSALLRLSLGKLYLEEGKTTLAIAHLREAVTMNPDYSAAWKLLGRALAESGDRTAAIESYERGIAKAHSQGDRQAEKEMEVFLRRLRRDQ